MKIPKIILFDLDNTLWNHQKAQDFALTCLGGYYDLPVNDFVEVYRFFNDRAWSLFTRGILSLENMRLYRFTLTFEALGDVASGLEPIKVNQHYLRIYGNRPFLCPYAEYVVSVLACNFKIGILTNGFRDTQLKKLDKTGIAKHIAFFFSPEDTGTLKPDIRFFKTALECINAKANEVIYIGDSFEEDVVGGKLSGLKTIWYNPVGRKIPPHTTYKPDAEIMDLRDLISLVGTIPKSVK